MPRPLRMRSEHSRYGTGIDVRKSFIEGNDVSANVWPAAEHGKEANKVGLSRMCERTGIKRSIL